MRTYKVEFINGKYQVYSRETDTLVWRWAFEGTFKTLKQAVLYCRLNNEAHQDVA